MSMSTETNDQVTADAALGMSDEEFASMDPSVFEQDYEDPATDEDVSESDEGEEDDTTLEDEELDPEEDDDATAESDDDEEPDDQDEDTDTEDDSEDDEENDADPDSNDEASEIDYKAEYERLTAPFRANGKELQVKNVDEAIQLMQMGANYNKKMAALKPSLKTLKVLEKNNLLDPQRLGHLIDLSKGDKGAIQKLLKDVGIDPLDFDTNEESDYKPNTYTADDREVELDSVLEDIQDTPTYAQTIEVVSNKWDSASQQTVANNPQLLKVINDHMANGIYERVSREVEKERTFGRLIGMSDIEAYKVVGDRLNDQGAFNDLVQGQAPAERKVVTPKRKRNDDSAVKAKKRAASSTKPKPAKTQPDFNPLALSDEEFEKQFNENLM